MDIEITLGIVAGCVVLLLFLLPRRKSRSIPTLQPHSGALGNLPDLAACGSFQQFLSKFHHLHGAIFGFWYGPLFAVSLADPKYIKCVGHLLAHHPVQTATLEIFLNKKCMGSISGEAWKRRRRLFWDSAFGPKSVSLRSARTSSLIREYCLPHWSALAETGASMATRDFFLRFAIRGIHVFALGESISGEEVERIYAPTRGMWDLLEKKIHGTATDAEIQSFDESCLRIREICNDLISARRRSSPSEKLFIDLVLTEKDEESVYSDVAAALLGGIHATSMLLVWSIYYLARYPEQQERIRTDIGESSDWTAATNSEYLGQFIDEVLRLSLLTTFIQRMNDGASISLPDGYVIPAGALVYINNESLLWNSTLYKNPCEFNPARFRDPESRSQHQFFPFSFLGGRSCPGKWLALQEVSMCLSALVQHFQIEFHHTQELPVETVASFFNHPKQDIRIRLRKRE